MSYGRGALAALGLAACACSLLPRREALPDLPQLELSRFLPAVRRQVEEAYQSARARPRDAGANGKLGMALEAHEQYGAAAVCYRRARALDRGSFQWAYFLGNVLAAQAQNEPAAAALREALRLDPDYLPARLKLGDVLLASGRWQECRALFDAVLKGHPDNATAWYGLGRAAAGLGDQPAAMDAWREACARFPDYGAAHYALALAYRRGGETNAAREHFARYEAHKNTVPPVDDPLRAAVSALSAGAVARVREGALLEQAGRLDEAVAAHHAALQVDPDLVQAHVNLISLYGRLGRPEKAEEHYRAILARGAGPADAHYNFGVLCFGRRRFAEARLAFFKALEINPQYAEAHNNLAFLLEQEGRTDQALRHYREAVAYKPDYRLAHFHLGRILVDRKNYEEGIRHLLRTLEPEDDKTPAYLFALTGAYARSGNRAAALEYGRRARDLAAARGQSQLLAGIDRDLRILERAGTGR